MTMDKEPSTSRPSVTPFKLPSKRIASKAERDWQKLAKELFRNRDEPA